jgi:hypothetical protein
MYIAGAVIVGAASFISYKVLFYQADQPQQRIVNNLAIHEYSFCNFLKYYGFDTVDKIKALEYLFSKALDKAATFSFNEIYPPRENFNELAKDVYDFLSLTQKNFVVRSGNQERWEVKAPSWIEENTVENTNNLKTLGFIDKVVPAIDNPDIVVVFGASNAIMQNRINYLEKLYTTGFVFQKVVLLSGERYVKEGLDGTIENLQNIALKYKLNFEKLTEMTLLEEIYLNSPVNNNIIPFISIDTPKGDLSRPTTFTTLLKFSDWLSSEPDIGNIILVSNQPYVQYQEAIVSEVLKSANNLQFQVIGDEFVLKNNIQTPVEALGTFIYAKTPEALMKLSEKITDPELISKLTELYKAQPLIYQSLSTIFAPDIDLIGQDSPIE